MVILIETRRTDIQPVADLLDPLLSRVFEHRLSPVEMRFWDESVFGHRDVGAIRFNGPDALRRIIWSPDELGVARGSSPGRST